MPGRRKTYKHYKDAELRDAIIIYARVGLEASPEQIARILTEASVTRKMVYDSLRRGLDKDSSK